MFSGDTHCSKREIPKVQQLFFLFQPISSTALVLLYDGAGAGGASGGMKLVMDPQEMLHFQPSIMAGHP